MSFATAMLGESVKRNEELRALLETANEDLERLAHRSVKLQDENEELRKKLKVSEEISDAHEREVEELETANAILKEAIKRWEDKEIHEAMNCYKENKANAVWKEIALKYYSLQPILKRWATEEEWEALGEAESAVTRLLDE